jgi:hypothetical protein
VAAAKRQLEDGDAGDEEDPEAKRRRILEETREIDAESEDDGEDDSSEDDSDDDEDETAELQRELEKIKRERAEKREQEVGSSFSFPQARPLCSHMADGIYHNRSERRRRRKRLNARRISPWGIPS